MLFTPVYCGVIAITASKALTELEGSFFELWSETWPIVVATAAMAAVVFLVKELALAGQPELQIVDLVVLSASGAVTYGIVLFSIGSPVIGEGAEVVGWIIRGHSAD